uniref:Uncharacterized protein n=2 Tax=Kalanchoe fedtschenkoi TaxID=63787 RepID=A0A7N0VGE0_KALFE
MSDHEQQLQVRQGRKKGGLITMPFIIANEAFEKVSSYGLLPNMILYLMQEYGMGLAGGTHVLFLWSAATNFMPVVGAFIADSYLGRFLAISLGSIISLLGMILIWLTAMIPKLRAPPCAGCKPASQAQLGVLYTSYALMSVGAGGIRSCSPGFGADQLDKRDDDSSNKRLLESYFSWYYAAASAAVLVSLTGIVYIQDHLGWKIGFAVPAALMFVSASLFLIASPLYVKYDVSTNLFSSFAHVIVASCTKWKVPFPSQSTGDKYYHHDKGSTHLVPTNKLRFLNKACIIRSHDEEVASDGSAVNPWRTCTVDQVEQLKSLIRIIPMWSTSIMMSVNSSQSTFQLVQAEAMDKHITRSFEIPAGSFNTFLVITMIVWLPIYDRGIIPVASKIYGKPVRLGVKLRMGIGLFFCGLSMVVAGVVEHVRRGRAIETMLLNNNTSEPVITMSAMWLIPQYVLQGVGEAFNVVGQLEFYYSEFPTSMASLAAALYWLGMAVANLLASGILSVVDDVTSKNGRTSWVTSDVNAARLDSYYWVLAALGFANVAYFVVCSFFYGPCSREVVKNEESKIEQDMSFEGRVVRRD